MGFQREGNRITLSVEINELEYRSLLVAIGMLTREARKIFRNVPELGWSFVSFINQLMQGNPAYAPYEVPANRTLPITLRQGKKSLP